MPGSRDEFRLNHSYLLPGPDSHPSNSHHPYVGNTHGGYSGGYPGMFFRYLQPKIKQELFCMWIDLPAPHHGFGQSTPHTQVQKHFNKN